MRPRKRDIPAIAIKPVGEPSGNCARLRKPPTEELLAAIIPDGQISKGRPGIQKRGPETSH